MSLLDRFKLTNKKAVVTGGARGIGQYGAIAFAELGADVAILDVLDGTETVEKVKAFGRDCFALKVDLTDEKNVEDAFSEILRRFATVDILFNNAGIARSTKAEEMTFEEWRRVMDINLSAEFLVARAAGRIMINNGKGGTIINTASMSGHIVNHPQEQCAYNASKAGVIQLTKSLAAEWAKYNIRVNSISPGYVSTLMSSGACQDWKNIWYAMSPMKRMCNPEELQGAIVYLASDASTFTTGTDILIDGGYTCL